MLGDLSLNVYYRDGNFVGGLRDLLYMIESEKLEFGS